MLVEPKRHAPDGGPGQQQRGKNPFDKRKAASGGGGGGGAARPAALTTVWTGGGVTRVAALKHPSPAFVLPAGPGRNAPARVRAATPQQQQQQQQHAATADLSDISLRQRTGALSPIDSAFDDSPLGATRAASPALPDDAFMMHSAFDLSSPSPFRRAAPSPVAGTLSPDKSGHGVPTTSGAIGRPIHVPYRPDLRAKMSRGLSVNMHNPPKPMTFRDYLLLAEACQRAGKARMEGHAHYKMGELLAQKRESLEKSISMFKKYLNICRRLNDLQGEAKALNCLGIVHQELGSDRALEAALEYHQQHSDMADAAGVFIANTNMGLIRGAQGNLTESVEHHKQALQYAVRAQDTQAEALALANLSLMGRTQGDHTTAKVCIERNLELCNTLKDEQASTDAYEQLGMISSDKKEWGTASDFLLQALDLSARQGNQGKSNAIRCKIGFVNGTMRMDDHFRSVAKVMGAKSERKKKWSTNR
ncbi:hypothetical protein DIPPA_28260 [Diplonema papillatum]|nr:hypothetical protein DIPPA_28260 [Diplonema papillatum]